MIEIKFSRHTLSTFEKMHYAWVIKVLMTCMVHLGKSIKIITIVFK
ncbi:MAG: hypothetical protein KAJ66_01285 [Candidatus Omnitrophica bacterium]|nr:hypothetical protein [Candidatus Omnitrophota bacterium]